MKYLRHDNRGLSLIELAIVVMIMSIISVVLAPQVMKWVDNSRVATDMQTMDSAVSFAQLALTDPGAYYDAQSSIITVQIDNDGCIVSCTDASHDIGNFAQSFANYAGQTRTAEGSGYRISGLKAKSAAASLAVMVVSGRVSAWSNLQGNVDLGINYEAASTPDVLTSGDTPLSVSSTVHFGGGSIAPGSNRGAGRTAPKAAGEAVIFTEDGGQLYLNNNLVVDTVDELKNVTLSEDDYPCWVYVGKSKLDETRTNTGVHTLYKWLGAKTSEGYPIWVRQTGNGL